MNHGDLPTQLADLIGRRILSGSLKSGDQLPPETEFLNQSGVSRTTMREAIKLLASKGLVEAKPKLGTWVRPSKDWSVLDPAVLRWRFEGEGADNLQDLLSLFEVRRMLEPEAAALAAARGDDAKLGAVRAAYDDLERASDAGDGLIEADVAFHLAVLDAAQNKYLAALGTVIEVAILSTARISLRRPGGLRHALPMHKAVGDAIHSHRPDLARAQMQTLLDDARHDVMTVMASAPAGAAKPRRAPTKGRT